MSRAGEPLWLNGRILAFLVEVCRRDHRVPLADLDDAVVDRIAGAPERAWEAGERHLGRLGATLFGVIEGASEIGGGRLLLATVCTFVFWELNGLKPPLQRPGMLYHVVRGAAGRKTQYARIAQLAEVRRWDRSL